MLIDLGSFRNSGSLVFAGRARGQAVRLDSGLEPAELREEHVEVHVPEDTFTVTTSFFLGMFGTSIQTLGEQKFLSRFSFTGKDISHVIRECVAEGVKTRSPLAAAE